MQRELRRRCLSQSLKQVKQLEETMKGLERRVEAQRRELKLNEQTMELMDQSRKLAEDQAYEAQKRPDLPRAPLSKVHFDRVVSVQTGGVVSCLAVTPEVTTPE